MFLQVVYQELTLLSFIIYTFSMAMASHDSDSEVINILYEDIGFVEDDSDFYVEVNDVQTQELFLKAIDWTYAF